MPVAHDRWAIHRGQTVVWPVVVTDEAGTPKNITGAVLEYRLAANAGIHPPTILLTSTGNPGVFSVTDAAGGAFTVTLSAATTLALVWTGPAYHEFWLTDAVGETDLVAAGSGKIVDTLRA
jgi:hypothetical protein